MSNASLFAGCRLFQELSPYSIVPAGGRSQHSALSGLVFKSSISGIGVRRNPAAYNPRMAIANNVTRMLDVRGIRYRSYEVPAEKLGAVEVADLLGLAREVVFKTIVVTREKPARPLLVLVSGESTVDLKKVAAAMGEKKVYLPSEREAEGITGLQAGGISALALLNKGFRVLIDSSAHSFEAICVSGGQRGLNVEIGVEDLAALTKAQFAQVSSPPVSHNSTGDQAIP